MVSRLSDSLFLAIVTGIIVTALLQSSSAVSIIIIGLLESRLIKLRPAMGIMLGANIGTTVTVQIIALPVISSYVYLLVGGACLTAVGLIRFNRITVWGVTLFSFGVVFAGLNMMTGYMLNPSLYRIMTAILAFSSHNPLLGLLIGLITTAVVQSSSAVTGITVSLAHSQMITLPSAVAIALGSNIGTCITAFIASINYGREASSLALGHFILNLTGVTLILPWLGLFVALVARTSPDLMRQIANAHTMFNIFSVIIFLPVLSLLIRYLQQRV